MDAGITANTMGKAWEMFVDSEWVLERMKCDEVTADKLKPDIRQAMM